MTAYEQPEGRWQADTLPRPFTDAFREASRLDAVHRAYDWHLHLATIRAEAEDLRRDAERLLEGEPVQTLDSERASGAMQLVGGHGADPADIASQVRAAAEMQSPIRFTDSADLDRFVDGWTAAHARVIGAVGNVGRYTWQRGLIMEAARGFFLTARIMTLEEDLSRGHVCFPLSDADSVNLDVDDLLARRMSPALRRFLWKQVVRARDSFAQSQRLVDDLDRTAAAAFRRWWFASLEILNHVERNDFDVWSRPPKLSLYHRAHVRFQARFSRTTFR